MATTHETTFATKYNSEDGSKVAKVLWDEEWSGFQVKLWVDKKYQKEATYHTDDLEDAVGTAKQMVK
jgi:hypothetical protein